MLTQSTVVNMRCCTAVLVIAIFLHTSSCLNGTCTKNSECHDPNTTCVKLVKGGCACQPITIAMQISCEKSIEAGRLFGMAITAFVVITVALVVGCVACYVGIGFLIYFLVTRLSHPQHEHHRRLHANVSQQSG